VVTAFDQRLEDTLVLVAENGSQIAQLRVMQQQNASQQDLNAQAIAELITENRAFRERQPSIFKASFLTIRKVPNKKGERSSDGLRA
jgi:hypothetical protein